MELTAGCSALSMRNLANAQLFTNTFMTLAQAISQDVPAHPEWQYTHKAFVPSLLCKTLMIGRKAATLGGQSADAVAQQLLAEDERAAAQPAPPCSKLVARAASEGRTYSPALIWSGVSTRPSMFNTSTCHVPAAAVSVMTLYKCNAALMSTRPATEELALPTEDALPAFPAAFTGLEAFTVFPVLLAGLLGGEISFCPPLLCTEDVRETGALF
ncbi:MAG: hypothetical protein FRX49_03259 [Trebouxia sp. A1-2]|nr:MAG: hypothetical protein FRX49_03259 [Trebouxia sp. A1-2]